jgi:hypothetical protein
MMEQFLTELVPVSEWPWALYKITFMENDGSTGPTQVMHLITTDTHLDNDVQARWPSSAYNWYTSELIQQCNEPARVPSRHGVQHVDCWAAGKAMADRLLTTAQ